MSKVPVLHKGFCIAVSDGSSLNYDILGQKVTKKTSSQVYNSVMHSLSINTENTGNHCILTPFSILRGAAFAGRDFLSHTIHTVQYCSICRYVDL